MGGDLAPKATVEGAVLAARDFGIEVVMVGDGEILAHELADHDAANLPIRIEHAPEVVLMDDSPLESVLSKPRSSIHVGLDLVKRGDASAFVSAGNSGAVMTASMMILGNLTYVDRPAIASLVPTSEGFSLLIDAGANTEVKPINLVQFAVMGSVYWRYVRNVSRPRVGILSNGEESSKGNEDTRAAAAMLEQMPTYVHYIGYVEGRDINRAKADVVVTDGFTGNVALKTMEGFSSFLLGSLREVFGGSWRTRIAYLLVRKNLNAMRERLDHRARIVEPQGDSQCDSRGGERATGASRQCRDSRNPRQDSAGRTGQARRRKRIQGVVRQNARTVTSPRKGSRSGGQARRFASRARGRWGRAARAGDGARHGPSRRCEDRTRQLRVDALAIGRHWLAQERSAGRARRDGISTSVDQRQCAGR